MKAVIMEIHKDYCIVVTRDGQFLKRKIPQGVFEIGDEIVIDQEYSFEPAKPAGTNWVKKFVVTISVAVVVVEALVLGVRYMRSFLSGDVYQYTGYEREELIVVGEEEEKKEEEAVVKAEPAEAEPEETIIYENIYSIEEGTEFEEFIGGIMFSYKVSDSDSLKIRIENVNSTPYFNGRFKITMLLSDGSKSSTKSILLQGFKPGQVRESTAAIRNEEVAFRLQVIGITY